MLYPSFDVYIDINILFSKINFLDIKKKKK